MLLETWTMAFGGVMSLWSHFTNDCTEVKGTSTTIRTNNSTGKNEFITSLISKMTVSDLVLQLHLMFADDIVGKDSLNELYDQTMHLSSQSPIGVMHDWYPMNKSYFNTLQQLQLNKSHLQIPMMVTGECLHGVGSFKQTIFPQNIAMAATWDTDIVYRVGRAIGTEASSIGIHGCFSPVLDLGQEPRWGRLQEAFGEDKILTSLIGVAYSSGLSKNGSWAEPDAVFPIMKHFAAHGAPQAGHNAAPFTGFGSRQIIQDLLIPFKAVYDLGGARGVMMAYNEIDGIPAAVHPMLYQALKDWGFDGITIADDTCIRNLLTQHKVASSQADAMQQWFNAGGMVDFYDWELDSYLNETKKLISSGAVSIKTLQSHVRKILGLKWDLGLFHDPFISKSIDPQANVAKHRDVAEEAAQKSVVLLKNDNNTLPLNVFSNAKVALIGPFADTLNFGDYSGALGQYPAMYASTLRQGMLDNIAHEKESKIQVRSSWGTNSWEYNNQYVIAPYLLSANGTRGGLLATYYSDTNFTTAQVSRIETPALDWGLYPPSGLSSNNFSTIWQGQLESPVDTDLIGWIGLAIGPNSTARLFLDGHLVMSKEYSQESGVMGNIQGYDWVLANGTLPPRDGVQFAFQPNHTYDVRIEFQTWNNYKKTANVSSVNSQLIFWWNLVSPDAEALAQATSIAEDSDIIVLAVGAAWNSDGESGDRATLGLAPSQDELARSMFALGKPVVMVLEGGRPFAIPDHYNSSAAVLSTFFGGQSGGQAIADVLFGKFNPGGRLPFSIPHHVGQLPVYYNYKPSARSVKYLDDPTEPSFPFGHGLSFSAFSQSSFSAIVETKPFCQTKNDISRLGREFGKGDYITFKASIKNEGSMDGSYVAQVYLLGRVSAVTQPLKQLVAFERVYLKAGEAKTVLMRLEVDRYLQILNRKGEWELERGSYTFALLDNGGSTVNTNRNVTLVCRG